MYQMHAHTHRETHICILDSQTKMNKKVTTVTIYDQYPPTLRITNH